MRVLHVLVPEPNGSVGGSDRHVLDLVRHLNQTYGPVGEIFSTLADQFAARAVEVGIVCHFTRRTLRWGTLRRLMAVIRSGRFGIVHAHGYEATWLAFAAVRLLRPRPKLVVTCHGWIETSAYMRFTSALDRWCDGWADGVVSVGHNLTPAVLACATRASTFAYIPNGIRTEPAEGDALLRARLGIPKHAVVVGGMGRLSPEKRFDLYVEVAGRVSRNNPDIYFLLAGSGQERESILAAAAEKIPAGRFNYIGLTDRPESLLATFDVLVQPSDTETTSRVLLEAMAQGVAVVATDVGSSISIIERGVNGVLVDRGDAEALAGAVLKLAADDVARTSIGRRARQTVCAGFSVEEMVRKTWDLYDEVLNGRGEMSAGSYMWSAR